MLLDELRSIVLDERDSGELTTISPDIFQKTASDIRAIQQKVYDHEDPFSDEARILIEKVSSIRETIEELYKIRTDKIVGLAQSQAEGSYIGREELRALIPTELEMFNRIVDAIRQSKSQLIDWRAGQGHHAAPVVPVCAEPCESGLEDEAPAVAERAEEEVSIESDPEIRSEAPFVYDIVQALSSMEPFMGVDGRTYELQVGDILTLPSRNAQVLVERDIVLNIHPG